ncbi:MAG TPA: hypothetical protein VJZ27_04130, partial [Aggregatilineales bacterium]|nr:hypothetical protein [Aggregatilineales bacterium]
MGDRKLLIFAARKFRIVLVFVLLSLLPISAVSARLDGNDRILVWTASVAIPGTQPANVPGSLATIDEDGNLVTMMDVPEQSSRVEACGIEAWSPDHSRLAMFMGNEVSPRGGGLYMKHGSDTPELIDEIHLLGCWGGSGRLRYAPDGNRFAYISYETNAQLGTFADGELTIRRVNNNYDVEATFTDVVAFDITDSGVAFVTFLVNQFQQADEIVLNWWEDGDNEDEVISLRASEGCEFISGYVKRGPDDFYWLALAERCSSTEWQLFRIEPDGSNALLAMQITPPGAVRTTSEVNNIIFSKNGNHFFYTLPDGLGNNRVSLNRVAVDDLFAPKTVIEQAVVMPGFALSKAAFATFSPDGNRMALPTNTPSGESALYVIDFNRPTATPTMITDFARNEVISFLQFTPNSRRIVYVAGGTDGGDNAIY